MRKLVKQLGAATVSVVSVAALSGGTALAHEGGSYSYRNHVNVSARSDSKSNVKVVENSSTWVNGRHVREDRRTYIDTNLVRRYGLDTELREHAVLAVGLLKAQHLQQPDLQALEAAVETNSQAIADSVGELYPGTEDQFLQLWRQHIEYYKQYLTSAEQNDTAGRDEAKQHLANFATDAANLLANENSQIDQNDLEEQLMTHGNQTVAIIDSLVEGNYVNVYSLAHEGYAHMGMVAASMAGNW